MNAIGYESQTINAEYSISLILLAWRYLPSMAEQSWIGVLLCLFLHWVGAISFLFFLPFKFSFCYSDIFYFILFFVLFVWFLLYQSQLYSLVYFVYHLIHIRVFPHIIESPHNILEEVVLTWEVGGAFLSVSQPREGRTCLIPCQGSRAHDTWLSGEAVSEFCFDTGFYQNFSKISVCYPLTASESDCSQRMSLCRLICFGVLKWTPLSGSVTTITTAGAWRSHLPRGCLQSSQNSKRSSQFHWGISKANSLCSSHAGGVWRVNP